LAVLRGVCQRTNIKEEVGNDIEVKVDKQALSDPTNNRIIT